MKIKRIIAAGMIVMLLLALAGVPVYAAETAESETAAVTEGDIKESEDYNTTKGSLYDWVYTFWYWIFGDSFTTAPKVCCILSVITIVAGMIVVFKKFVR